MNYRNVLSVWNGANYDHCVDIQHAVVGNRAMICASWSESSLLRGVWIYRMRLVYGVVTLVHPQVRVARSSDDWGMETGKVGGDEAVPTMVELLQLREFQKRWVREILKH